jgi:hypothetical protein
MHARTLTSSWRIVALIAVAALIVQCNSGSDSGDQRKVAQFVGDFSGILAEDGAPAVTGQVTALDIDGKPVKLTDQPDSLSREGYGTYWVVDGR